MQGKKSARLSFPALCAVNLLVSRITLGLHIKAVEELSHGEEEEQAGQTGRRIGSGDRCLFPPDKMPQVRLDPD